MANLIVTIISIGLFAVAVIVGAYYGGQAFQQGQYNAIANAIVSEAQQINLAQRLWSTNNNQPDMTGNGIDALVTAKEFAEYPAIAGNQLGFTASLSGSWNNGCYNYQGYQGRFWRYPMTYNSGNYIVYYFATNLPYTAPCDTLAGSFATNNTDVSQINNPIVKITAAINGKLTPTTSNFVINAIGIASATTFIQPAISTAVSGWASIAGDPYADTNGTLMSNLCYLAANNLILCVFGPS